MSKARDLADLMSTGGILEDGALSTSEIVNVTAAPEELNLLDGATVTTDEINKLDGVTATTAELNKLAGTTATTSDFDKLSNVTASATELNYMTGATSSIQSQLDNISVTSGSLTKSFTSGESATITLAQSITPAPVVSVTKEVAQTGQSSKGAWDVNATASNYDLHNTAYDTTLQKSTVTTGTAYSTTPQGSTLTYTNSSAGASGLNCRGLSISPDGTKAIVISDGAYMHSLSLSTAFDISTASVTVSNGTSGWPTNSLGGYVKPDGTKMWVVDYGSQGLSEYSLSTAWDVSTKTLLAGHSANLPGDIIDFQWKPDGTMGFAADYANGQILQFTATTPFDFNTTGVPYTYNISNISANTLMNIQFKPDGTELYASVNNNSSYNVLKLSLNTAWDLSGTVTESAHIADMSASPFSVSRTIGFFVYYNNGASAYYASYGNDTIYQFNMQASSTGLALGTGSFASTDVGKRIQGNGGDVILTSTAGAYDTTGGSDFTDTSTIASGSWTMHGLKSAGDADGLTLSGIANSYDIANSSNIQTYSGVSSYADFPTGLYVKPDGTRFYYVDKDSTRRAIYEFTMSTAYDVTTATSTDALVVGSNDTSPTDVKFKPDGTKMYFLGDAQDRVYQYDLSTAWNLGSASYGGKFKGTNHSSSTGFYLKPDGTTLYTIGTDGNCYQHTMSTAWDISTAGSYVATKDLGATNGTGDATIAFSDDGTKLFFIRQSNRTIFQWNLSTAWDLSTATYSNISFDYTSEIGSLGGAYFGNGGEYVYLLDYTNQDINRYTVGDFTIPTSQYNLAVTKTSGQIDSSTWLDINSMTADQSLGDGEAYYAVSTDDRTTWSVAKGSDGVRPIVRDNAGTWQYNNDQGTTVGFDLANASFDNKTLVSTGTPYSAFMKPDGTRLYVCEFGGRNVREYALSTAGDISTGSLSNTYTISSSWSDLYVTGVFFKPDGTKMWTGDYNNNQFVEHDLSTAWDTSTATAARAKSNPVAGYARNIFFKPDGTKAYFLSDNGYIYEHDLSTAWDITTATYNSVNFNITYNAYGIWLNNDGTKLYVLNQSSVFRQYSLSTAYNISTASDDSITYSFTGGGGVVVYGAVFNSDGTSLIEISSGAATLYQHSTGELSFTTSTTWTNATTNDEFYALQQALGATSVNRMNKTQLDAVADGSHFTLGNTLDLMIALKQDTASASLPTSDGVTINYDAAALNQGAVLGTDYDFDFPANNKVRITSNAAQNLKIRVV